MRTIIAGSRLNAGNPRVLRLAREHLLTALRFMPWQISEVVSGHNLHSYDLIGEQWADHHGLPVDRFRAKWGLHGQAAGRIRNGLMANNAEALLALWNGTSPGTANMIEAMQKRGLPTFVWMV